jgi:hypothetical protein
MAFLDICAIITDQAVVGCDREFTAWVIGTVTARRAYASAC